ncbi:MAG TPA: tetratricopeptide repeat protein, partial [Ignavibacteriales bacterium]|nr:tetratricopeptide repeat protein [Ignavibacteriales bacterium]
MKFLSLIVSFFSNLGRRKRRTVSKTKAAEPKAPDAMSFFRSGIQNYSSTRYNAAIGDFTQAISIRGNFHQAFYNRGLSRLKIDDNQGANIDFSKAIEIHPVYAKAYMNRGIAKNRLGDPEGAQEDFLKSVEIEPKLYPLFTVRKIKVTKPKQAEGEGVQPEELKSAGQRNESSKALPAEEAEESQIPGAEYVNEEEGFMKPLAFESEKDEFSSLTPVEEEESEASAEQVDSDNEEEDASEGNMFEEQIPEDEFTEKSTDVQENEGENGISGTENSEEENGISGTDDAEEDEDDFSKMLSMEIEKELLQELPGITDEKKTDDYSEASLQDEKKDSLSLENLPSAANETKDESIEKAVAQDEVILAEDGPGNNQAKAEDIPGKDKEGLTAENVTKPGNPEKGGSSLDLTEPEDSAEEIRMPLQDSEDIFDESELTEYIEEEEEQQARIEVEASDDETPEERANNAADALDPGIFEQGATIELPEQSEIKRILAETLPDSRLNYARGFFYRAKLKQDAGDLTGAVLDYTNAIEFHPKFSQAYLQRGISASELNELEDAIADYSKSIEYSHRNPAAYYNRALVNQKSGKNREALADFTKAIIFEPRNPQLYLLRGMLRYEMGQMRSAFSDWSRADILGSKQAREML